MFWLLIILFSRVNSFEIQFSNRSSYFDNSYFKIYQTSPYEKLYGFDKSRMCVLSRNIVSGWMVSIQPVNSVEKTGPTKISQYRDFDPRACFFYNDHSYLIFQNKNATSITRGWDQKIVTNFPFGELRFDHIETRLYLIQDNKIDEINLSSIEGMWISNNTNLNYKTIGSMPSQYTDFMIVERKIYLINNKKIYRYDFGSNEILPKFVTNSDGELFTFSVFREYERIKISDSNIWLFFLSIFDLIVLVICVSVIRFLKIRRRNNSSSSIFNDQNVYKGIYRIWPCLTVSRCSPSLTFYANLTGASLMNYAIS